MLASIDAMVAVDESGTVVDVNPATGRLLGFRPEDLVGRPVRDTLIPPGDRSAFDERWAQSSWHDHDPRLFDRMALRADGTQVPVEASTAVAHGAGGRTFITFLRDLSSDHEIVRARDVFRFLAKVSNVLGESPLDPLERLRAFAREFVPEHVDWCAIDTLDHSGDLQRVVVEHVDPEKVALAYQLLAQYPPDRASKVGAWEVVRTARAQLFEDIPDSMLVEAAQDDEHLRILRSLGLNSVLIVPMMARDKVLGVITLVTAGSGRRLTKADVPVFEEVAVRSGILIDNARLFAERSHVAQTLQQSLLPPVLPAIDGLDVAARFVSATDGVDVGGDFYDIFPTDPGDWAVVLGDVSGKGAEAAAMTALARYTIRAAAISARRPSAVLSTLNRAIVQQETDRFCTACYVRVRVSPASIRLTIARGGHPRPLLLRASGRLEEIAGDGAVLGLFDDVILEDRSARLNPGDSLILFTDGVTEARGERGLLGERTLRGFLRSMAGKPAREIASSVEQMATDWQQGNPRDDIAVVVLQAPRRQA